MSWGTVTIGGVAFRETMQLADDGTTVKLSGQEAHPPLTQAEVRARHLNVRGLRGATVSAVFEDKSQADGFYRVTDATSDLFSFAGGAVLTATWSMTLERVGSERDVEFESRVPTIARATGLAGQTPSFWHAPPPATIDYYTGATVPAATVTRDSSEGSVLVYRGIPAGVAPRWTCPAAGYMAAGPRVLLDGIRHAGTDTPAHTAWELSNGLVRVRPEVGRIFVACWNGSAWVSDKRYEFRVSSTMMTAAPTFTILRNDPEEVTVRLTYPSAPGRFTVDLGLRRGSRFVTGVIKRHASGTLLVVKTPSETATVVTGGAVATAVDTDGNRYVVGSANGTVNATASATRTGTSLDFFLGHEVGATPAAGDAFADLLAQYLGCSGDRTRVVRR